MKKGSFVLSVLMAGLIIAGSAGLGRAGDLKVDAFVDVLYFIQNDQPTIDGGAKNLVESQFVAKAELDLEKTNGNVTFRLDLDFPSSETGPADRDTDTTCVVNSPDANADGVCDATNSTSTDGGGSLGNTLAGTNMSVTGLPGGPNTFAEHIEQAKFVWAVPGLPIGLNLTGGVFNSPIGYESQDAPDRSFVTYGQLFAEVPSNLAGIELAASHGPFSASGLFTDDWDADLVGPVAGTGWKLPASEKNSYGLTFGYADSENPLPNISVGYITTSNTRDATLDIIIAGSLMPNSHHDLSYAVEYLTDDLQDGLAVTLGIRHGSHALHVRYDRVDVDAVAAVGTAPATTDKTPSSITVSASCGLGSDTLIARLEYVTYDSDVSGANSADADMILLQFVATLN